MLGVLPRAVRGAFLLVIALSRGAAAEPARRESFAVSAGVCFGLEPLELRVDNSTRVHRGIWLHLAFVQATALGLGTRLEDASTGLVGAELRSCAWNGRACSLGSMAIGAFHSSSEGAEAQDDYNPTDYQTGGVMELQGALELGAPLGPYLRIGVDARLRVSDETRFGGGLTVGIGVRF